MITRERAIEAIVTKIASFPNDLRRFTNTSFKGFDNLSDKEVEQFYNIYALELDVPDSVRVIAEKELPRDQVIELLVLNYRKRVEALDDEDIQYLVEEELEGKVTLPVDSLGSPRLKRVLKSAERTNIDNLEYEEDYDDGVPADPEPFEIEESEISDDPDYGSPEIEDSVPDYNNDDVVWVDKTPSPSTMPKLPRFDYKLNYNAPAIKRAKKYDGSELKGNLDLKNGELPRNTKLSVPHGHRDVRAELKSSVRSQQRGQE